MNFVYRFFSYLYDTIYPPSKDAHIVRALDTVVVQKMYSYRFVNDVHVLSTYNDERIRALIHEAKFQGNKQAFLLLGKLLSTYMKTLPQTDYIFPIPLSSKRLRTRGYNQVVEVVRRAVLQPDTEICTNILIRTRDTQPQTELKRDERLVNVRDAFGVADKSTIIGKHILIIDDVMTTGATLRAAKTALLPHSPASVTCVALAH